MSFAVAPISSESLHARTHTYTLAFQKEVDAHVGPYTYTLSLDRHTLWLRWSLNRQNDVTHVEAFNESLHTGIPVAIATHLHTRAWNVDHQTPSHTHPAAYTPN
jgi:hypothetical protein